VDAFGKRAGKPLLHRAVLTRVPAAIRPRLLRGVVQELRAERVDLLPTGLVEKEAFRALFTVGGGFEALEAHGVWGVIAARQNTASYVADVLELAQREEPARAAAIAEAGR